MDLILKKPIEELTPQMIEFNNAELLQYVKDFLAPYKETKFDESNIAEAKETTATLNKMSKHLNDWRIEIGRVYLDPYEKFKKQVDEVKAEIDNTTAEIKKIVTEHNEQLKAEKQAQIESLYNKYFANLTDIVALNIIFNQKWLNSGYKLQIIEKDMLDLRTRVENDLKAMNTLVAENDRAEFLIEYSRSLNFGFVLSELKRKQERKAYLESLANEKPKNIDYSPETPETTNNTQATATVGNKAEIPPEKPFEDVGTTENIYTIQFEMEMTRAQAFALKVFLETNKIKYKKL